MKRIYAAKSMIMCVLLATRSISCTSGVGKAEPDVSIIMRSGYTRFAGAAVLTVASATAVVSAVSAETEEA